MRLLLIVNATASSVTARRRVVIQAALGSGHSLEVAETKERGHATELARTAAADGVDCVVVLAGDGTLNEAANGLVGTETALAPLPGGSTNVFARTIGFSTDAIEATGQLLQALDTREFQRVGVGSVDGRRFLFHAGFGFDAAVVEQVERRSSLKRWFAHPLFLVSAFDTWFRRFDRKKDRFEVELESGEVVERVGLAIASNTNPYTYLGNMPVKIDPGLGLDSELTLTLWQDLKLIMLIRTGVSTLGSRRTFRRHRKVQQYRHVERFRISGGQEIHYQVDGDHLGTGSHFDVCFEPDALTLVIPTA
ncbi:MAG: sphingosine/diacylglycerol kinaselike enzyme [Actinomycetia bacterium]|nr:sphingosine/diacylglycerol kinaselike enzyme [Actinomycetes bacterium]